MKHLEWKNFHSEILFSLLSRSYTVSDLQVTENFYKQFYNFIGLTEDETNVFCSDLENIEYTTNEKQTFLFIQRIDKGVLFENNLDTKYSDEPTLRLPWIAERIPPTVIVGSVSASRRIWLIMDVVVVFPWVPATAMDCL